MSKLTHMFDPDRVDVFDYLRKSAGEYARCQSRLPVDGVLAIFHRRMKEWATNPEDLRALLFSLAFVDRLDLAALALKTFFKSDIDLQFYFTDDVKYYSVLRLNFFSHSHLSIGINRAIREQARYHDLSWLVGIFCLLLWYMQSPFFVAGDITLNHEDEPREAGLAYCSNKHDHFLIPDHTFAASSAWDFLKTCYQENSVAWSKRSPVAFWRGSTTGLIKDEQCGWRSLPRIKLCEIGKHSQGIIDAGITSIVQIPDPGCMQYLKENNLLVPHVHYTEFIKYKYQIDIDGNVNSWPGLFQKLCTGSTVLKVASPDGFKQWYYDRLLPWENYVPVESNLSDLQEKILWLRDHDDLAEKIGSNGRALALSMSIETEFDRGSKTIADAIAFFSARLNIRTTDSPRRLSGDGLDIMERKISDTYTAISKDLFGEDVWQDFQPILSKENTVQGWNGNHPSFRTYIKTLPIPVVIDVGVWKGLSTIFLAEELTAVYGDGCVIAVDTFLGSSEHWDNNSGLFLRMTGRPNLYDIFLHNVFYSGKSGVVVPMPQTSVTAAEILAKKNIKAGLIHIDASHEYQDVVRDLQLYWPLVEFGGYLICDDYDSSWPGVIKAVNEFCEKNKLSFIVHHPKCIIQKI